MTSITMSDLSPELLAKHDGWLRALVLRLVDDGQADDVMQEVWGQAMGAELHDQKALPAWLAKVARRIAGKSIRSKQRRRNHEQVASQSASILALDPADLVARVEGRQQVARTVLELAEPFRTVVLLRYFEDQTPEQIAQKLNIPGATVRTRLHRAHEHLRKRFESERGKEWRGQLAGLVAPLGALGGSPQPRPPIATAHPKALLLLVPPAVAALVWVTMQAIAPTQPPVTGPNSAGDVAQMVTSGPVLNDVVTTNLRDSVTADERSTGAPTAQTTVRIAGQVLDYAGVPLPDLEIIFAKGWPKDAGPDAADCQPLGQCDREGRFDVQVPREQGTLRVSHKFATLRSWSVSGKEAPAGIDDALVVATRFVQLTGVVVDQDGKPAPEQIVTADYQDTVGLPVAASGTHLERYRIKVATDAVGNFQMSNVPAFPFGTLAVGQVRSEESVISIPTQDRHDLHLVLGTKNSKSQKRSKTKKDAPTLVRFAIAGTVVTLGGEPIRGASARVVNAQADAQTEEDGKFKLSFLALTGSPVSMWVAAKGYEPMQLEVLLFEDDHPTLVTARLARLSDDTRAMAGKIVNEHNDPVSGLIVTLADATPLDHGRFVPRFVERPSTHRLGAHDTTDSDGKFRIPGVLDRAYHLRIIDEATGFAQTHGPFDARQESTIQITQPRVRPELRVRVGNILGEDIEGAEVELEVVLLSTETQSEYSSRTITSNVGEARKAITDLAGNCRFLDAPGGDLLITITKPGYITQTITYKDNANLAEVDLMRLLPFRVATTGLDSDWLKLKLFDVFGNELEIQSAWRGNHFPGIHRFAIVRNHSVVASFPESVCRAELYSIFTDKLVRTMPVIPNPTDITILDFPN